MFTQGLDGNALKWATEQKDLQYSNSNLRPRVDPLTTVRGGGRSIGLPPPSAFRSGHLPSTAIRVSAARRGDADDSASPSDNDMTYDSEDDAYGGRYSIDSSPQEERIPNGGAHAYRNPGRRLPRYASDYTYSEVSSSRETTVGATRNLPERVMRNGFTEDESSDSAASSEFSTTQTGSIRSAVPSRVYPEAAARKDVGTKNQQTGQFSDDEEVPSAPPFSSSHVEIKKELDEISASVDQSVNMEHSVKSMKPDHASRASADAEAAAAQSGVHPGRLPTFHASALGPWHAVLAYDACVRLCLHAWARGCMEAPMFLNDECKLLRDSFGLQQVLLQSEEELLGKRSSDLTSEPSAAKPKAALGKMKVQVRKVKTTSDPPTGCSMSSLRAPVIKLETIRFRLAHLQYVLSSRWRAISKIRVAPHLRTNGSFSRQSLAYVHAGTRYIKQVSGLLKIGVTSLRNSSSSYEVVQGHTSSETYSCILRLKSSSEDDGVKMQLGSGEAHVFFPDGMGDDLIVEVQDSKGKHFGRVVAQVATIADDPADKIRWWSIYREPEHEPVGKLQLYINYSTSADDNSQPKCGSVAETVAYDFVLEVAMKVQHFQQRNLLLYGSWKWLLTEFASYYGVSDIYSKLRYLSYVMDVGTPTADCLTLVYDLLVPVVMKGNSKSTLSHQENRLLGETKDQIEQILALAFENYKSLDESSFSGIMDVFKPASGLAPPALEPAVKLYTLLHDILSPESQTKLCQYFQAAARKRSKRHLAETDEFVTNNSEPNFMDTVAMTTAYQKMTYLCNNVKNEILTDIEIHNQHILPSFVDLPNLSASIYSTELCNRLRAFLLACPPSGPSPPVAELVIATADFERDLASWNISPIKGGVDAKELFHLYIMLWIQDKRLSMLESCKLDKVKWAGVRTQHATTPFVDEMYDRLKDTLRDYEVIICRWPEYVFVLENAVADVAKAVVEALDKQYADVLAPLKENLTPKKFGLKYVQKLAKRSVCSYTVPDELGILLNSLKRMLDVLSPKIETQFKSWGSCIPASGNTAPGERLSEVTVMLRAKFRSYLQAVVEKLAENTKLQNSTKLKKILQDSKGIVAESDIRSRMQPLKEQLTHTIDHLHTCFENTVFIAVCRWYWDRMGQDILTFLENRKENRSWYKGSRIAVSVLDDTFASQMQQLLGNSLPEKDLEPPRSMMEVRSMLCKDATNHNDNTYYY